MSSSGASGIGRASKVVDCEVLLASVLRNVSEPKLYEQITLQTFTGEYGARASQHRRGMMFEQWAFKNEAAELRRSLAPLLALPAEEVWCRNFDDELYGSQFDRLGGGIQAQRLHRTRNVLRDLAAGKDVPEVLIHAQLSLDIQDVKTIYPIPDLLVLNRSAGVYLPGELKSFMLRDDVGDPGDLDTTRRQLGVYDLALEQELSRIGIGNRITRKAVLQFGTPFGFKLAPPKIETIEPAVHQIRRAIDAMARVHTRLIDLGNADGKPTLDIWYQLQRNFREACYSACILAPSCAAENVHRARHLGDRAAALLGPDTDIDRVIAMLHGSPPVTREDSERLAVLREAAVALGLTSQTARRAS
jgi:hypothetical protein